MIQNIRSKVDNVIGKMAELVVGKAKKVGRFVAQAGVPQDPNERLRLAAKASISAARKLSGNVTKSLLNPILAGIKVRYGLRDLRLYEKGGTWWVKAIINPEVDQDLNVAPGEAGMPE